MTSFAELIKDPQLTKALEQLNYESPTEVQLRAIPSVLAGKDVLVSSKTGSGKTAAFLLPSLELVLSKAQRNPTSARILIITPTRELARQILKNAQQLIKFTSLKVAMIAGGEDFKYQKSLLRKSPDIIVGTPGRLAEHVMHKSTDFSGLDFLILDEADRMFDMGLNDDVLAIAKTCDEQRQTLLFSATLEPTGVRHLIKQVVLQPAEEIFLQDAQTAIQQQMVLADDLKHKEKLLRAILDKTHFEKAIVFANTKARVAELEKYLRFHQFKVSALHGDITQDDRRIALDMFRQGKTQVLMATDVAARGLDIQGVDLVINVDMAHSGDEFLHRVGRTGRADQKGLAISFVAAKDWNLTKGIERYLGIELETIIVPGLEATYKGPEKLKNSGKAAGIKKKTSDSKTQKTDQPKIKVRDRDKKNIGKRRKPSESSKAGEIVQSDLGDGFSVFKKSKKPE